MPQRRRPPVNYPNYDHPPYREPDTAGIFRGLQPTISTGVIVTGIVVWAFNTFAQISYVKEQNASLASLIEQRHKEAIDHSDMNRDRMLAVMEEIKDNLKSLQQEQRRVPYQYRNQ